MDRDTFLARVGRAAMHAELPAPPLVPDRLPELESRDLVSLFRQRALMVNAVVHGPMSRHGAPRAVAGIASGHSAGTFMAWDDLPITGVPTALAAAGLNRMSHDIPTDNRLDHQLGYLSLDVGVTGADAGLAESGSIVLLHGPGRPRMASLIPEVHIAILESALIERTLADWAHRHPEAPAGTANAVVVTGPSRTGDIEQILNLGVHGPRHLHVVLVS